MSSCAIIPTIFNKKGEKVDSKLFKDLLFYAPDRQTALMWYEKIQSDSFIKTWFPVLDLDENGEPTIQSLFEKTNLKIKVKEYDDEVLKRLNRDIGKYKKGSNRLALYINNDHNAKMLIERAIQFNTTSAYRDKFVATVQKIPDSESNRIFIGITIDRKNALNSIDAKNMAYNESLNNKLISILESKGISIGALTDLERRLGISGVTDFSIAKTSAEGIIELIRLADGIEGQKALPEEFAHFALAAMEDHPLVERLFNIIESNGLSREILGDEYDTYEVLYSGNEDMLTEEAAGKLLAKHLLKNEDIPSKPYRTLLQRVIQAVKNFFKNISANSIQRAIREVDKEAGTIARGILDSSLDNAIKVKNISKSESFYNISDRVQRDRKLLKRIIENELKRLKVYEKRNPNSSFDTNQKLLIESLETDLEAHNEIDGIYSFISSALEELSKVSNRLVVLQNTPATNINERAKVLRDIRNYYYSYSHIIDDLTEALREEEKYADDRYGQRVKVVLDNITLLLRDLKIDYNKVAMPLFVSFIKPFLGESLTVPFGKYKGRTFTAEELIKTAEEDISFFDRWLDSMADSSDIILKVIDRAVKESKERARLSTIEVMKKLQAATIELEQAGVKDTEWMFERDLEGNLTGNYISEINQGLFTKKYKEMIDSLKKQYGDNPIGDDAQKFKQERQAWVDANMEIVNGKKVPKLSIYGNPEFKNLDSARKKYYNTIMEIKGTLDSYLPERYTRLNRTVKIRKDLIERVKASDGIKSGGKQLWEALKDQFIRRTDDSEFADKATIKDFEGHEVQVLPIYYTKLKEGESENDVSTDIVATLTAYASMANDYDEMNKIIDILETGRDLLRNRKVIQTSGNKKLVERFKSMGREVESYVFKKGEETRFIERLNDFFEMQVYHRYMADEGTFGGKIDKGKLANFVNRVTSLNTLALNILSGISNVATGKIMMRIESFSKEFFSESNTLIADKNYAKALPEYLAEIGNRVKVSKLALWDELFNVMQEYEQDVKEVNFDRKTWFSRMFNSSSLFFMNNAGEHWMQNRTSLALADAYKMKSPDGKIVSLWDAMEVVYIDKNNKKRGARLQVKNGYTKEDGTEFTREDIISFSRRAAAINQRMHGIYNYADRNAVQRLAIGRMGMMFRKWMKPSLNRRFKSATYNYDLQAWTEGYYVTLGRFLNTIRKEIKEGQFSLIANYDQLTPTEKANIRRAITEVGHFLAITLVLGLIDWSDNDDRPWLTKMLEYQSRRLYTELGVMIPGPQMVKEGLRIVKSPAAGINTMEDALSLISLMNPFNYETVAGEDAILQSGKYKGESRATKIFFDSPIIPMNRTIYRGLHPEEGIPFFKQ